MPATIVAKRSSSSTRSAASRATSVPDFPIATPMFASCSAGASFTPSPVIATTWPRRRSATAMRSLSSGETRATTTPSWSTISPSAWSSAGRSALVRTGSPSRRSPTSVAMAAAVSGWSPVIMARRTWARRQASTASCTSGRGGSSMPTRPSRVSPCSASASVSTGPGVASRRATASTRRPRLVIADTSALAAATSTQRGSTASGAPFTSTSPSTTTDIRRRWWSNGKRATSGRARRSASVSRPRRWANASIAASVGSPWANHAPSSS